jgi:DNA-binding response OmpR family regulator
MIPHILVIDDQINLSRFITLELHAEGYQVSIICNNKPELLSVQALKPDLIVLNWELRRASGRKIYQQLRTVNSHIPIVVITVKDKSDCRSAPPLGAQTCLTKPFSMTDLLTVIEFHLQGEMKQRVECSMCN